METIRINEKTPNGGDYSEIFYMDDQENVVDEKDATKAVVRECLNDGTLVFETWMMITE